MGTSGKRLAVITAVTVTSVLALAVVGIYAYSVGRMLLTNPYYHGRTELPAPLPGAEEVTAMLPKGPQNLELVFSMDGSGSSSTMEGYIDLGTGKYGEDCAYHLTGVTTQDSTWEGSTEELRAPGSMVYARSLDESGAPASDGMGGWSGGFYNSTRGTWTLFSPVVAFSGPVVKGGGQGWCAVSLLDDVATLGPDGAVVFDSAAAQAMTTRGMAAYVDEMMDAYDASYWDRATAGSDLLGVAPVDMGSFLEAPLSITRDGETTALTQRSQYDGSVMVEARFTPTAYQDVVAPDVPTEFDHIRASGAGLDDTVSIPVPAQ